MIFYKHYDKGNDGQVIMASHVKMEFERDEQLQLEGVDLDLMAQLVQNPFNFKNFYDQISADRRLAITKVRCAKQFVGRLRP